MTNQARATQALGLQRAAVTGSRAKRAAPQQGSGSNACVETQVLGFVTGRQMPVRPKYKGSIRRLKVVHGSLAIGAA